VPLGKPFVNKYASTSTTDDSSDSSDTEDEDSTPQKKKKGGKGKRNLVIKHSNRSPKDQHDDIMGVEKMKARRGSAKKKKKSRKRTREMTIGDSQLGGLLLRFSHSARLKTHVVFTHRGDAVGAKEEEEEAC
jgi:hypothetical protein